MDQKLLEATGWQTLLFLVTLRTTVGHQELPPNLLCILWPMPVTFHVDRSVSLVPDELLGSLCDDPGLHQGSEGSVMPGSRWLPPL